MYDKLKGQSNILKEGRNEKLQTNEEFKLEKKRRRRHYRSDVHLHSGE